MKKIGTKILLTSAMAVSFYGCGNDSSSSKINEAVIEEPKIDRCYNAYGIDADFGWSETISAGSYLEKMVCDKVSERTTNLLSFFARCVSASYSNSNNRFDIEVNTENGIHHLWADVNNCRYKLGVGDDYQFEYFVANAPEWNFDECYCKTENNVAYYRNDEIIASNK